MAGEIISRISEIESNIEDSYTACQEKGASLPVNRVSDNLPATIRAIPTQEMPPERTEADMTVSGATVTAPAGWYKQAASKAVPTATQATPSITVGANGLITAKANQSEGYVSGGEKSATEQLPTTAGKTVTPSNAEQTVVSEGTFVTGDIKVAKIPDSYIQPSGTKSITENGTHDVKAYASVEVNVAGSGGGGGGAVETCTIEIVDLYMDEFETYIFATVLENGVVRPYSNMSIRDPIPPYTISNVVCGSMIVICVSNSSNDTPLAVVSGGVTDVEARNIEQADSGRYVNMYVLIAPDTPGAHGTICATI